MALKLLIALLTTGIAWAEPTPVLVRIRILTRHHPREIVLTQDGKRLVVSLESQLPLSFDGKSLEVELVGSKLRRRYAGRLHVSTDRGELALVNSVGLEDYVASVTLSESGWVAPQAMMAQAVLARTWALTHLRPDAPYDFDDLTDSQVYQGLFPQASSTARILAPTGGMILSYGGKPARVVYHGECGERIHSAQEIWGGHVPYLVSRNLPEKVLARRRPSSWTRLLKKARVAAILGVQPPKQVVWDTGERDGLRGVQVGADWFPVDEFRLRIGRVLGWNEIRSNEFSLQDLGTEIKLSGKGLGHNVGMCQSDAAAMADLGWSFDRILSFFYPGTDLNKRMP